MEKVNIMKSVYKGLLVDGAIPHKTVHLRMTAFGITCGSNKKGRTGKRIRCSCTQQVFVTIGIDT